MLGKLLSKIKRVIAIPLLLVGSIFGMAASDIFSGVKNSYGFSGMTLKDFICPMLSSTNTSYDLTFKLVSNSETTYEIRFTSFLTCLTLGTSTTKESYLYKIGTKDISVTVPILCIKDADKYKMKVTYSISNLSVSGTLFDVDICPYNNEKFYAKDSKKVELVDIFLTLRNGKFIVSGLYFDFSYIRYDLLVNLPYGKIPIKYFKMILKENPLGKPIIFNTQFDPEISIGVSEDFSSPIDGKNVFTYSKDGRLISNPNYSLFYLEQVYKRSDDIVTFKLSGDFHLNDSTNDLWKSKQGESYDHEVSDIYIGYRYQKYYKGEKSLVLYFSDPVLKFYLYYVIPITFNDEVYTEVETTSEVVGDFKENESKPNKIYIIP